MTKLTDQEKLLIARRAAGEYAISTRITQILKSHRKNRNPEDEIFLEFASLVQKKTYSYDTYKKLAAIILDRIPNPWNCNASISNSAPIANTVEQKTVRCRKKRRTVTCRLCGNTGHNARTCKEHDNALNQLSLPRVERGFDPRKVPAKSDSSSKLDGESPDSLHEGEEGGNESVSKSLNW